MDDYDIEKLKRIGEVMLGGYAVTSDINRVTCDCQRCHNPARHTVTSTSALVPGLLERHLCDEHFAIFTKFYPEMEQSPPEIPPPSGIELDIPPGHTE